MCNKFKKRRYNQNFLLLLSLTLIACAGNKTKNSTNVGNKELISFHLNAPPATVEPLLLSELADSVSYVALETKKETLTDYSIQYGDRYYTIIEKNLFCFDKNGKFLHPVGKRGQGPEEYTRMNYDYFKVDITTNWVYVSGTKGKFLIYDENGHYLNSLNQVFFYSRIIKMVYNSIAYIHAPDTCYVIDTHTNQIIRTYSTNTEILKKNMTIFRTNSGKNIHNLPGERVESNSSNDAFYFRDVSFSDTIFVAYNKQIRPFCLLSAKNKYKFEDRYTDPSRSMVYQPLVLRMQAFKEKLLLCVQYTTSEKDCFMDKKENFYWVVCNFNDGSVMYHSYNIVNDLDGGPNILVNKKDINCLSVEDLKNDEEIYNSYFTDGVKAKFKDQDGKFQRLFESLADDANPIIRTIHWKE